MKFEFNVTLKDPVSCDILQIRVRVEFSHTAFSYGNGYHATLSRGGCLIQTLDCRYDKNLNPHDLRSYAEKIIRNYWTGKRGSYNIMCLEPCY